MAQDNAGKSLPKVVIVPLDSGLVEVKKLPLGKYALVLQELQKVPEILELIMEKDTTEIVSELPSIVATSWSDLVGIISIATGVSKQELEEEIGLSEGIDLVTAIIEANDFFGVAQSLGKLQEIWKQKKAQHDKAQLAKTVDKSRGTATRGSGKAGSKK